MEYLDLQVEELFSGTTTKLNFNSTIQQLRQCGQTTLVLASLGSTQARAMVIPVSACKYGIVGTCTDKRYNKP